MLRAVILAALTLTAGCTQRADPTEPSEAPPEPGELALTETDEITDEVTAPTDEVDEDADAAAPPTLRTKAKSKIMKVIGHSALRAARYADID